LTKFFGTSFPTFRMSWATCLSFYYPSRQSGRSSPRLYTEWASLSFSWLAACKSEAACQPPQLLSNPLRSSSISLSGIIASSVRTSVFFLQADLMKSDPTCKTTATNAAPHCIVLNCQSHHPGLSLDGDRIGLYFSAACLIGLRPLISRIHWPTRLRTTKSKGTGNASTERDGDEIQLNKFYKSRLTNLDDVEDIMQMPIQPSVTAPQHAQPLPSGRAGASDILVESSVNVWKGYKPTSSTS
jgi:hypothetical protein